LFRSLEDKGIKIGIATGRTSSVEDEWLRFKRLGLDGYISAIVTSREVERRKPAPDVIIECAKRMDVPIEKCIVVGDTESDIVAAKRAGAIAVAVTTGHEDKEALLRAQPEIVLRDVNDLIVYLESFFLPL
jgi:phosphoglycolate phosphatase